MMYERKVMLRKRMENKVFCPIPVLQGQAGSGDWTKGRLQLR